MSSDGLEPEAEIEVAATSGDDASGVSRRGLMRTAAVAGAAAAGAAVIALPRAAGADPTAPTVAREALTPTAPSHVATKGYVDAQDDALSAEIDTKIAEATIAVETASSNAVELSFAADRIVSRTATGAVTVTGTGYAAGRSVTLRVVAGGSERGLSFPAGWRFVSFKPSTIAAGKVGVLAATSFGTTEAEVVAAWAAEA